MTSHKILVEHDTELHDLYCQLILECDRTCFFRKSKLKRDEKVKSLNEQCHQIIKNTIAKDLSLEAWSIDHDGNPSKADFMMGKVSVCVAYDYDKTHEKTLKEELSLSREVISALNCYLEIEDEFDADEEDKATIFSNLNDALVKLDNFKNASK